MALTQAEKSAGRLFRDAAREQLTLPAAPGGVNAAACPPVISVWRHVCPEQEGRTRPVRLDRVEWVNPEVWVTWNPRAGSSEAPLWEALWQHEAEDRLQSGIIAEYVVIQRGRFSFTWVHGECRKCHMTVRSRDGIFAEKVRRMEQEGSAADRFIKELPEVCAP